MKQSHGSLGALLQMQALMKHCLHSSMKGVDRPEQIDAIVKTVTVNSIPKSILHVPRHVLKCNYKLLPKTLISYFHHARKASPRVSKGLAIA